MTKIPLVQNEPSLSERASPPQMSAHKLPVDTQKVSTGLLPDTEGAKQVTDNETPKVDLSLLDDDYWANLRALLQTFGSAPRFAVLTAG